MSEPLSRAKLRDMPQDEFERRHDEIQRWMAAGAKDGEPAPSHERPQGHQFTRAEIREMTEAEYDANRDRIEQQVTAGQVAAPDNTPRRQGRR